jgi:hypothetical protein
VLFSALNSSRKSLSKKGNADNVMLHVPAGYSNFRIEHGGQKRLA